MIPFLDLKKINSTFQPQLGEAVRRVVESGSFVRGSELARFEAAYADFIGTKHCVGTGNGFDALRLIFRAWITLGILREGDEVIVPANTYIASLLAVTENRLNVVLVEPDIDTFTIDPHRVGEKVTSRTRAIMLVHLYGRNAMHPQIAMLCRKYELMLVEDNAQAAGCFAGGRRTGSLGNAAAHSFFPTKNLGAMGDGGAVTTNDATLADTVRTLANYGSARKGENELQGVNSRLDELQAAVLAVKLPRLDADNGRRRLIADFYRDHIRHPEIVLPTGPQLSEEHVWHLFVVRCARRDALRTYLYDQGVETLVHYPLPPHLQRAYSGMNSLRHPITERIHREVLSLPLYPALVQEEWRRIADAVNSFPRR